MIKKIFLGAVALLLLVGLTTTVSAFSLDFLKAKNKNQQIDFGDDGGINLKNKSKAQGHEQNINIKEGENDNIIFRFFNRNKSKNQNVDISQPIPKNNNGSLIKKLFNFFK